MLAVAALALVVVIFLLAPHYNDAQRAGSASAFRAAVGDDRGRFAAAAVIDVLFALSYAVLAWSIAARLTARCSSVRSLARTGALAMTIGALADVVENVLVLRGIDQWSRAEDGLFEAVVAFGNAKWAFAVVGCLLALGAWRAARRQPAGAS